MRRSFTCWAAAFAFFISFASWCVQLGGLGRLQETCASDLDLNQNDIFPVLDFLATSQTSLEQLALLDPASQVAMAQKFVLSTYPQLLQAMGTVASRSATGAFTLTPDTQCKDYYRYFWVNMSFQFVTLVLVGVSLAMRKEAFTQVACCCMLTLTTILSIENCHTSYYINALAPQQVPKQAKVFLAGCVGTAAGNLMLITILGMQQPALMPQAALDDEAGFATNGAVKATPTTA